MRPKRWQILLLSVLLISSLLISILPIQIPFGGAGVASATATIEVITTTPGGSKWTVPAGVTSVEVLVVAGGGGGQSGGGGAGGLLYNAAYSVTPAEEITCTVGAGGAIGTVGTQSQFGTLIASGGGAGAAVNAGGGNGGSGGGAGATGAATQYGGHTIVPPTQGYDGGDSINITAPYGASGGGGAGGVGGGVVSAGVCGNGGIGLDYHTQFGSAPPIPNSGLFAGGGGGATWSAGGTQGTASFGGGAGNHDGGTAGIDNTGGGGGGAGEGHYGGVGGKGVVILKYTPPLSQTITTLTATSITTSSAILNGNVTSLGDYGNVTQYGFVLSTSTQSNPGNVSPSAQTDYEAGEWTWAEDINYGAGQTFDSDGNVTGLSKGTYYYFRAVGYSTYGWVYGDELSFSTLATPITGYLYKKQLLFNTSATGANIASAQGSFPVCVAINESSWPTVAERATFFDDSNVGGKRVQFYDGDDTTINLDYEVETYANDTLTVWGDSITRGFYASATQQSWAQLIGTNYNWAINNHGVSSREVADYTVVAYAHQTGTTDKTATLTGFNDNLHWGTDATALDENQSITYALAAWNSIPHANKITGQGAVTTSGTWTNSTYYGGTLGIWADATNEYVELTVHGTVAYVGLTALYAGGGNYSITVDTVEKATGVCTLTKTPASTLAYAPILVRIGNLTDVDHTVRITVKSANKVQFDWAAGNENTTNFFLGNCLYSGTYVFSAPFNQGSDAGADAINSHLSVVASTLLADGLKVYYVDASSNYDVPEHYSGDNTHPSDAGHEHIATAFIAAINAATLTAGNKEAIYWVRVPSITGNSTIDSIWVAYGNDPNELNQDDPEDVWVGYSTVQHLADNSWGDNPEAKDSTSNHYDGSDSGTHILPSIDSPVGRGRQFDVSTLSSLSLPDFYVSTITVGAWISSGSSAFQMIVGKDNGGNPGRDYTLQTNYGYLQSYIWNTSLDYGYQVGSTSISSWCYASMTYDSAIVNLPVLYVNGVLEGDGGHVHISGAINNGAAGIGIGTSPSYSAPYYGSIDEVRISSSARSANWIKLEYYSMAKTNFNGDSGVSAPFLSWRAAIENTPDISNTPSSWSVGVVQPSQTYWPNGAGEKTLSQLETSDSITLYGGTYVRGGERLNSWPTSTISSIDFYLKKITGLTGTAYVRVRAVSDDSIIETLGSIDVSTLTTSQAWYTFDTTPVVIPSVQDIRIQMEYAGGNGSVFLYVGQYTPSDVYAGGVRTIYSSQTENYTDTSGYEITWRNLTYTSAEPPFPLETSGCWGNITNNSSFAVDILASMTDMTGGTTWSIGSSPGTNVFTLKVGIAGTANIGNFTTLSNTPVAWITSMAAGNMTRWTMVFYTPTNSPQFADGAPKSGNMTFEAEAS